MWAVVTRKRKPTKAFNKRLKTLNYHVMKLPSLATQYDYLYTWYVFHECPSCDPTIYMLYTYVYVYMTDHITAGKQGSIMYHILNIMGPSKPLH